MTAAQDLDANRRASRAWERRRWPQWAYYVRESARRRQQRRPVLHSDPMADRYRQATIARAFTIAGGVVVLDADIAKTQVDPGVTGSHGPLFSVGFGPVRWAVVPVASADADAEPVDGEGLEVDAAMVFRHLDDAGTLQGFSREPSTSESSGGSRTAHQFINSDKATSRGDLVYLSVLSVNNAGPVPAIRIVAISGLSLVEAL